MEKKIESARVVPRTYEDFEPYCSWQRDDRSDTLVVHVPEFKKNQLKVQINSSGILTVKGERPVDETKWTRFSKQIKLSKDCHTSDIHAKFAAGLLYITMPKKIFAASRTSTGQPAKTNTPVETEQKVVKSQEKASDEKPKMFDHAEMIKPGSSNKDTYKVENYEFWRKSLGKKSRLGKKVALSLAFATMLAVGAFFTYKLYRTAPHVNN